MRLACDGNKTQQFDLQHIKYDKPLTDMANIYEQYATMQ
jgi:hypothetical protein